MMRKNFTKPAILTILALFNYGCSTDIEKTGSFNILNNVSKPKPSVDNRLLLGGSSSVLEQTKDAFSHPSNKLSPEELTKFLEGEEFFDETWQVATSVSKERDGLGTFFNGASCIVCHVADGRGRPPRGGEVMESMLLRISLPGHGSHNEPVPSNIYGDQLQGFAIPGVKPEAKVDISYQDIMGRYDDGENYILKKPIYKIVNPEYGQLERGLMISPRVANQMSGMGLMEDIPERDILALNDPGDRDRDGISGKANYVWDTEKQKFSLGRFGWKANQPSVRQQVAGAFSGDVGITTSIFPKENYSDIQFKLLKKENTLSGGNPELENSDLDKVVVYSRNLSVPARRDINNPDVIAGERIFEQISCNKCHTITMKSQGETIHPYTDLLLHDMGSDLADNRPDFMADGNEWRTPPLWTIGLFRTVNDHTNYLHDGRANNLT
ncbi:thiol oxidoreductase, partial [bacterium]